MYDPILPASLLPVVAGRERQRITAVAHQLGMFCAQITTAHQARVFGVQYVLEPPGRTRS